MKLFIRSIFLIAITLVLTGIFGELMLRLKNSNQKNYVIEMWKYANNLKRIADNPNLGHIHQRDKEATLQGVKIAINSLGMRGPEIRDFSIDKKKVLLLGSSITLGWGVKENETVRAVLEKKLGNKFLVLNGGIGNYNVVRSVINYEQHWRDIIKPDYIVLHYFINDAEYLHPSKENLVFKHSQLAVILYHIVQGLLQGSPDIFNLVEHYKKVYAPTSRGYKEMLVALDKLKNIADKDGTKIILAMIPDIHQLQNYPFKFVHESMQQISADRGWLYIDFLENLSSFMGPELWTIPGDPHPNGVAHDIMAKQLFHSIN